MSDRRTEYSPSHNHCKRTIIPRPAPTLPKPHYPSKIANTLASLVKGRWIEGKAQTVALLLSACDMPTLFMLQTLLPSRRRDCHTTISLPRTNPSQNLTIPRKSPTPLPLNERSVCFALSLASHHVLASLVKGRWLDGKAQALTLLHLLAICPLFLYCILFCRQDGGIVTPTLACINPSRTALSLEKHYILARHRKRVRFCCSVKPSQLWW